MERTCGQKQEDSKAVATDVELPGQRILAEQLIGIVEKRREAARSVRQKTDALIGGDLV